MRMNPPHASLTRREFLGATAISAATLALPNPLRAEHAGRPLAERATATITFPTASIPDLLRRHADDLKRIKVDKERLRVLSGRR